MDRLSIQISRHFRIVFLFIALSVSPLAWSEQVLVNGSEEGQAILPAAWREPLQGPVSVYVNAGRMKAKVRVPGENKESLDFPCRRLEGAQRVAYDSRCDLEPSLPHAQLDRAVLLRYRGPNRAPTLPLPLRP